jgi:glycerate 2-kinase
VTRPVLVAPDSFKGTFSAAEVAAAVAAGVRSAGLEALEMPVADGGEGTMNVLGGSAVSAVVSGPLGDPVDASFALREDGSAVVECAAASGLGLVTEAERDAWAASTYGTGELIAAACEAGATSVLVAVGGSATTDGGAGAIEAMKEAGVAPRMEVLCDVRTAWEDAPRVFGPQKGADPDTVKRLERRLAKLAAEAPKDPRGVPMSGAAGGLAGGLWAHFGAKLLPGAPYVLDALGFDAAIRTAIFVVTGEGRLDRQSLQGKAAGEVATRCRQSGVPCRAVVGSVELDEFEQRILDLERVIEATTLEQLEEAGVLLAHQST